MKMFAVILIHKEKRLKKIMKPEMIMKRYFRNWQVAVFVTLRWSSLVMKDEVVNMVMTWQYYFGDSIPPACNDSPGYLIRLYEVCSLATWLVK